MAPGGEDRVMLGFSMKKYARWLRAQLVEIDQLESEPITATMFDDLRSVIDEAERHAAKAGMADAVRACQIRQGPIGVGLARRVLSACLAACADEPSRETLTVPQVARQLKKSRDTVRNWISAGKLPASNLNCPGKRPRWIVKRDDLDVFLKKCQPDPRPAKSRRRRDPDDVIEFF
jgi:excisionase family DNA binding protein